MEIRLDRHIRYSNEHLVSEILHSCQDMRMILLNLTPGQSLPPRTSSSSVSLQVVSGRGELLNGCDWVPAEQGSIRLYPPGEAHGIRAMDGPVSVLAVLAPRP